MKEDDFNDYVPSILNPRVYKKDNKDISLTQNSIVSRCSLSLRRNSGISKWKQKVNETPTRNKENSQNVPNFVSQPPPPLNISENVIDLRAAPENSSNQKEVQEEEGSIGYSAIQDLNTIRKSHSSPLSFGDIIPFIPITQQTGNGSIRSVSSTTDLIECLSDKKSEKTVIYEVQKPAVNVSFGIQNCKNVEVSTKNSSIKRILVSHKDDHTNVDCEVVESSELSIASDLEENMNETFSPHSSRTRKLEVAVNLDIKRKKLSDDIDDNSKVLILNTDAIEKISHVIVQPPNYKLVKRKIPSKNRNSCVNKKIVGSPGKNGRSDNLKQKRIESYFCKSDSQLSSGIIKKLDDAGGAIIARDDVQVMSKTLSIAEAANKLNRLKRDNESPKSIRNKTEGESAKRNDVKSSNSDAPRGGSPRSRNDSISSYSPRKTADSLTFNLPSKAKIAKSTVSSKTIPHHKIVAGTHFAVDAFSYGEIPNVKYYFLTHFHSDHYSGLKKTFNKLLFCSQVTADLCISRLGVNSKCIHIINLNETIKVEGVDVTAVDANHCPGAIMLVFTLPNGKTLLHCGDFRACPMMESYPIFWNKDIHTIYLDTTYCNPRYDFPTQEQSLEMALYLLRQKKFALEKVGKKFSSVLIVCGTYTIGKEKFFLGMARRVGCTVWAFPEKDRVLQLVEGRSFSQAPAHSCQLHVLAMRDLTYEKLKTYLESLQGAFTEVVAFKPSGWENEKNSTVEKDVVTIHGIPYSEHSSFSEMIRFVKFLKPKQVVPTVDISGGIKAVQKYFPCPLLYKEDMQSQSKLSDYFSIHNKQQVPAVT